MSITLNLSLEEIADMKRFTHAGSEAEGGLRAARAFVRISRLRELKATSGHVDFENNWERLETLELGEADFPR